MLRHSLITASLILTLTTTAYAQGAPASTPAVEKNDDDTVRCRKLTVTGSLVKKKKICKTLAEWRAASAEGNRQARDILDSGLACGGGPSCNGG